jgi:hypothetical protein
MNNMKVKLNFIKFMEIFRIHDFCQKIDVLPIACVFCGGGRIR